ncbi:MAG TPA: DUF58 domain-containing protein [Acidimicrobiales bacterium]|nr:DUF58 domain-containing protein [Acidimicrobiales bacterium]
MSPAPRAAVAMAGVALLALVLPAAVVGLAVLALATLTLVDALSVRRPPSVRREVDTVLSRGVPTALTVVAESDAAGHLLVRQPVPPDLRLVPSEAEGRIDALVTPRRRGRHPLPPPAVRATGPLGLGRWDHNAGPDEEVLVYPDLPAARRLVLAVRQGRFRDQGRLSRGPLGLGTDFELVRDYVPDDDVRQVNWRATARMDRPMSNQYRVDQDRDVVCLVDAGRLMASPIGDRTRLDAALDGVTAVAMVADEVGDRCGAIAFDATVLRAVPARRSGGTAVVQALFDLEPSSLDSDYEMAFHRVGRSKRAFVLVLTDLLDEAAARPLVEAVPMLARRHSVAVASVTDPDLTRLLDQPPATPLDVYGASVAVEVLEARAQVAARLTAAGAQVLEAPPGLLGEACVGAYLRMKALARL